MVLLSQRMESQCRFYCNTVSSDGIYHKIVVYQTRERMFYVILRKLKRQRRQRLRKRQNDRTIGLRFVSQMTISSSLSKHRKRIEKAWILKSNSTLPVGDESLLRV